MRKHRPLHLFAVFLLSLTTGVAQSSVETVTAALLREAARESAAQIRAASVSVLVMPEHTPTLVTQVFAEELHNRGLNVLTTPIPEADVLHVDVRELSFSTAMGQNSSYLRNLVAVIAVLISSETDKTYRWSKEFVLTHTDTLSTRPVVTEGDFLNDRPGFWSSILEPLMLIAAGAVIVILLFTVRGSS